MSNLVTRAVELIYQMDNGQINEVIEAVKLKRQHLARQATRAVILGDIVEFDARGRKVIGKVTKVNQKTLQVREDRGGLVSTNWKVTASLVRKVEVA
jgi:hypothetical protein